MMMQPILFGTRVVDLASFSSTLDSETVAIIGYMKHVTDAHYLYNYYFHLPIEKKAEFYSMMLDEHGIDLSTLQYKHLRIPYAVDLEQGVAREAYVIHYDKHLKGGSALDFIAVKGPSDIGLDWWHNKERFNRNDEEYKTSIKILNDGWV